MGTFPSRRLTVHTHSLAVFCGDGVTARNRAPNSRDILAALSSGLTIIEVQHSAQPLAALDRSCLIRAGLFPHDQAIAEALVVPLVMIMHHKFVDGLPQ